MILFAGDLTNVGNLEDVVRFAELLSKVDCEEKYVIAGNHDFCFDNSLRNIAKEILTNKGITYIDNEIITTKSGLTIFGSPNCPYLHNWAFYTTGKQFFNLYSNVEYVDILLTHCPPLGILDEVNNQGYPENVGERQITNYINRHHPKLVVCGHIHEQNGIIKKGSTTIVNASILNDEYKYTYKPISINL